MERFIQGFRYDGEHRTLTIEIAGVEVAESIDLVNRVTGHLPGRDRVLADATRPAGTPITEGRRKLEDAAASAGMEVTHAARGVPVAVPKGEGPEGVAINETLAEQAARLTSLGKFEVPEVDGQSPGTLKITKISVKDDHLVVGLDGGWWLKIGSKDAVLAVQAPKPKSEAPAKESPAKEEKVEEKPKSKAKSEVKVEAVPVSPVEISDELVEELKAMDAIRSVIGTLNTKAGVGKADMLAVCQALSSRVPVIAKTQNLGDRVPRLLNVLGINQ